jgi:replicative DNA helicase
VFHAMHGGRPAVFSLEMGAKVLLSRTVCSEARVQLHALRADFVPKEDRKRLHDALSRIMNTQLMIDDNPSATLEDIERKITLSRDVSLVVVDYLQLMATRGKAENRTQEVGAFSRGLKILARKLNVPFLVLSQLSRANEQRAERTPQLSDLRDSGSIEQDADVVTFVHREWVYKQDRDDLRDQAELIIAKQRNGPIGKVPLRFIGEYTRFENVEEYQMEEAA